MEKNHVHGGNNITIHIYKTHCQYYATKKMNSDHPKRFRQLYVRTPMTAMSHPRRPSPWVCHIALAWPEHSKSKWSWQHESVNICFKAKSSGKDRFFLPPTILLSSCKCSCILILGVSCNHLPLIWISKSDLFVIKPGSEPLQPLFEKPLVAASLGWNWMLIKKQSYQLSLPRSLLAVLSY